MNKNNAAAKPLFTDKQLDLLNRIFDAADKTADNHIERSLIKPLSGDIFNLLKKRECVGVHGKYIWITKLGVKALTDSAPAVSAEKISEVMTVKKSPKVVDRNVVTLDWAFRRLRRQALNYFGKDLDDAAKKTMRAESDKITEGYQDLANFFAPKGIFADEWVNFMESFFAHEIHPGARSK